MMSDLSEVDRHAPLDIRFVSERSHPGMVESDLTYVAARGQRRAASLLRPAGSGPFPVILYADWVEPKACDSNRTQFLDEAKAMAQKGCTSLLIETMWSDREWFLKRTQADDYDASVRQATELQRAMDLLLS